MKRAEVDVESRKRKLGSRRKELKVKEYAEHEESRIYTQKWKGLIQPSHYSQNVYDLQWFYSHA